jgi:hypothetical protein
LASQIREDLAVTAILDSELPSEQLALHWTLYQRNFIPCPTIKLPASCFWCTPTPLFEEKGNLRSLALVAKLTNPGWIARPMAMATFTASDKPVYVCEINVVQRTKEWFSADETD